MSVCQYINMSVCQYVRMRLFRSGIKMKVVRNVIRMSDRHYVSMSVCQYVSMSICQQVYMSVCQYVRMQLFSLGIKMKVGYNVIRMSDSQKIFVRKSLRTAKEPALVKTPCLAQAPSHTYASKETIRTMLILGASRCMSSSAVNLVEIEKLSNLNKVIKQCLSEPAIYC